MNDETIAKNFSLICEKCTEISIEDIEHEVSSRIILGKPDFFEERDYYNYLQNFKQFFNKTDDFHLELQFSLTIGSIKKSIRLFHLSGEALATYDIIYRRQKIAPKVFISIQTGIIEIPNLFTNKLFELSTVKPKIWLRGIWENSYRRYSDVFNNYGLFNECIGEYRNWEVLTSGSINQDKDLDEKFRIVEAYGDKEYWGKIENHISINKQGITINKFLGEYDSPSMSGNYNIIKTKFPLTKLSEIVKEASNYYHIHNNLPDNKVKVCIVPGGFECFEAMLLPFYDSFLINEAWEIQIDIYYKNKSDFAREF